MKFCAACESPIIFTEKVTLTEVTRSLFKTITGRCQCDGEYVTFEMVTSDDGFLDWEHQ